MWLIPYLLSFDVFGGNAQQFGSKNALEMLVNTKVINVKNNKNITYIYDLNSSQHSLYVFL